MSKCTTSEDAKRASVKCSRVIKRRFIIERNELILVLLKCIRLKQTNIFAQVATIKSILQ